MKKSKEKSEKTHSFTKEEIADIRGRRELYRIENYKATMLLNAIEENMNAIIDAAKLRYKIPADKQIKVDMEAGTFTVIEKQEEPKDVGPTT